MTQRVLVTGGAGYIGSHACKVLAEAGCRPIAYDDLSRGFDWAVKWGPLERGRLQDGARLDEVMERHRPDAVMHFAAFAYVGESMEKPELYLENNVEGSRSLIEAAKRAGVRRFVFSSTCAIFGEPERVPVDEENPKRPLSPYGQSKLRVEELLREEAAGGGLESICLRYFNVAGADPDGEIGEAHDPETHLIPLVLQTAAGLRPSIKVFGDDYDTPDGTCIRDYIQVTDLAEAHLLALRALQGGAGWRAYNLGNGNGFSVREVIETARRVTGREIPVEIAPRRPGDPAKVIAASAKIMDELGWHPRLGELERIIETAWRWMASPNYPGGPLVKL